MRWLILLLHVSIIVVVQNALLRFLSVDGITPDFFLIFAVYIALHANVYEAVISTWFIGLVKDLFTISNLGINALLFLIVGFVLVKTKKYFFIENPISIAISAFLVSIVYNAMWIAGLAITDVPITFQGTVTKIFFVSILNGLLSPVLFFLMKKLRFGKGFIVKDVSKTY